LRRLRSDYCTLAAEIIKLVFCICQIPLKFFNNAFGRCATIFAMTDGIQGTKWISTTAFAVTSTSGDLKKSEVTGGDTFRNTAGPLAETTTGLGNAMSDGLQCACRIWPAAGAVAAAAEYLFHPWITGRNAFGYAAGSLPWSTAGSNNRVGLTMPDGLQCACRIWPAAGAVATAAKHFMCTRITGRDTFSYTAGTLSNATTGGSNRVGFTVPDGLQCACWIWPSADAVTAAAKHFMCAGITGRDTLGYTAGTLSDATTGGSNRFDFTMSDGLQCPCRVWSTAGAVTTTTEYFVHTRVTGRDTFGYTTGPLSSSTAGGDNRVGFTVPNRL